MKKTICLLIAATLLIPVIVGCKKGGENKPSSSATAGTKDGYYPNVPDVNYNGATFIVMGKSADSNWGEIGLFSDGTDGTVLNDAVYNRNSKVEEDCNIKIVPYEVFDSNANNGEFYNQILSNSLSGDYIADICCIPIVDACNLVTKNPFVDLKTVPYVDLGAEWWQQKINKSVSLLNRQYFAFNDMMLNDKRDTYLIYFNKTTFSDNNLDYPYQYVMDGTWTNDKMLELIREYGGADLNANGVADLGDNIAYIYLLNDTFFVGAGITGAALDNDGYPYMLDCTEKTVNVYDKIVELFNISPFATYGFGTTEDANGCFDNGGLFLNFHMYHMMEIAQTYQSDVGIVPCPKYSEDQKEYYSRAGFNGATAITILTSTQNLERAGIVLEIFSAESKNIITPAFYKKLFTDRYTNDEESKEMLDIVIKSEIIDLDQVFKWGELLVFASAAAARGGSAARVYDRLLPGAKARLEKTVDEYSALESAG